jgi:ribulose-5-phosphate 4-epimerase/fuculose-1-phosphate aldolase
MTYAPPMSRTAHLSGLATPPEFASAEDERRHRKQRLTAGIRLFAKYGFSEGVAGHITARDPEFPDRFWVNPFGVSFSDVSAGDLLLVNASGTVIKGDGPLNGAAFAIHSAIHQARPDVVSAAHAHSVYGRSVAALGELVLPITQDACAFYGDHALFDDYAGLVLDPAEGRRIATTLGNRKALVLRNHGLLTVGQTVDSAVWWFIAMERSCQVQLAVQAAGNPVIINPASAQQTYREVGSEMAGYVSFQTLWHEIVREQPGLLNDSQAIE